MGDRYNGSMLKNKDIFSIKLLIIMIKRSTFYMLPMISLSFTFFGFGAWEMFFTNQSEFWFRYEDIVGSLIAFGVVFFLIGTIALLILPQKLSDFFLVEVEAFSIAFYIQGNFLPNNYGALDGTEIIWSNYVNRGIIGGVVWIVILIIPVIFFFSKRRQIVEVIMRFLVMFVMTTQVLSIGIIWFAYKDKFEESNNYLSKQGEFEVSSGNNTIVFLLDCFDAEVMRELIKQKPDEINETFTDFTFYNNCVGGATRTNYAIPYIMTGMINTREVSYREYIDYAYSKSPLISVLNSGQFDSRFFTEKTLVSTDTNVAIDNLEDGIPEVSSSSKLTQHFLKLVMFRYVPQFLKKYFWIYTGDFDSFKKNDKEKSEYAANDYSFYKELCKGVKISYDQPVFRFYHLNGAHPPYILDENIEIRKEITEWNYGTNAELVQAYASCMIVKEYIKQLKDLGLYDSATIVVMSDHGAGRGIEQNPLFMVKKSCSKHIFMISEKRLSYSSLADYFSKVLKNPYIDIEEYATKNRRKFYVESENNGVISITEWSSNGDAYNYDSFRQTGVVYHGDTFKLNRKYTLGEVIKFTTEATGNKYAVKGISKNENTHTWTDGEEVEFLFNIDKRLRTDLLFTISYSIYSTFQRVMVYSGDVFLGEFKSYGMEERRIIIPCETVNNGKLDIRFILPDAKSPFSEGESSDSRKLALALKTLCIDKYSPPKISFGEVLYFNNEENNGAKYIIDGFSKPESTATWTNGNEAILSFAINDEYSNLELNISYGTFNEKQRFDLYVNEILIAKIIAIGEENRSFIIPHDAVPDGVAKLRFCFHDAEAPKNVSETSTDTRLLALFIKEITLNNSEKDFSFVAQTDGAYILGNELIFSAEGYNAGEYLSCGFSSPEYTGTWTDGHKSEMKFVLTDYKNENIFLNMKYFAYRENQHVKIYAGDTLIDEYDATCDTNRKIRIPQYCIDDNELSIRFEFPNASSPFENGESGDKRILALFVKTMTLIKEH